MVVIYPSASDCWMSKQDCWADNPGQDEQQCQVQLEMVQGMMRDVRANTAKLVLLRQMYRRSRWLQQLSQPKNTCD